MNATTASRSLRFHPLRFLLVLAFVFVDFAGSDAAETDFKGYFEEDRVAKTVFGSFSSFTLDEAKRCVAHLDEELQRDPGNEFFSGMRSVILSVFRASHAAESALADSEKQTQAAERLDRLAQESMKPSALSGRVDGLTAGRYQREAEKLRRNSNEAVARAEAELRSSLEDALDFATFCRDRGRGRIGTMFQQLAKLKGQLITSSTDRLAYWSEDEAARAMAVEDLIHDALARGSRAILEHRYFEIDRVVSEALRSVPNNAWLLDLKRASDDAMKRSGEALAEARQAKETKQYETAEIFAEKSVAAAADNEAALALKGELDTIIREKTELLTKAVALEAGGAFEDAFEIYERYAQVEDSQRVAGSLAQEKEKAGDFIGANKHFKIAGDSEGMLRTQRLMEEQVDAYKEAETLLAENKFSEARLIFEKYNDKDGKRNVDLMEGRRETFLGNFDRAMTLFREARSAEDVESLNHFLEERAKNLDLAETAEASGNLQTALAHFEAANDGGGVRRIALILAKKMEDEELYGSAVNFYEMADDHAAAAKLREKIPSDQLGYKSLTPKEIFEQCDPACLTVLNLENDGLGSGFFVARGGYVLTNWHVVRQAPIVMLRLSDGRVAMAKVVDSSELPDLALLKTDIGHHSVLKLGDSGLVKTGEPISVIGTPIDPALSSTLGSGHIAATGREFHKNKVLQIDATINHGNSGGPLLNNTAQVIGINTFGLGDMGIQGLNFSIEINEALPMLQRNRVPGF
ncbi:MAG: trypsin-like peptidase domain-containing protein [Verrucomicrobiales bacterium]